MKIYVNEDISVLFNHILNILKKDKWDQIEAMLRKQATILDNLNKIKKKQIKLIKSEQIGTRNSLLILGLLAETKNLVLYTINMIKAHRDFVANNSVVIDNDITG